MLDWLPHQVKVSRLIQDEAEEMINRYGAEAYAISSNLARDMRHKRDAERSLHWAKVTACIAARTKPRPLNSMMVRQVL